MSCFGYKVSEKAGWDECLLANIILFTRSLSAFFS